MRSILITGGTGFLGRGLTAEALKQGIRRICIYSRGEVAQYEMRQAFGDEPRLRWMIGDVRDRNRLTRAMNEVDTVIHAAALKRVEVGQYNPGEMVATNVLGSMNVIEAATDAGVRKVLLVSSDKACEPANAYGCSKAMAEHLFLGANTARGVNGPRFSVVRYGNVAGSTGSVIPIWRKIIREGGSARLTNPDATRFWMTLQEAVELVMGTARTMMGGELAIPDLPAYRLGDLAAAMGVAYAPPTGLTDGEKMHESMRSGQTSADARRMSIEELTEALRHV